MNIPKSALTFGLIETIISTLASLAIPILAGEIVDGFSIETLSAGVIILLSSLFFSKQLWTDFPPTYWVQ